MNILHAVEVVAEPVVQKRIAQIAEALARLLESGPGRFAEHESLVNTVLQEGGRRALEAELQRLEHALPERILVNGVEYREHPSTLRPLKACIEPSSRREKLRTTGGWTGSPVSPAAFGRR